MSFSRALSSKRSTKPAAALAASVALCAGALVSTAGQAEAAPSTAAATASAATTGLSRAGAVRTAAVAAAPISAVALSSAMLGTAASLAGRPYRWGGNGPTAFDCSGYTRYVYAQWGISIPRTAQQQYRASRKISKSAIRPGDLVFFLSGGYAYHVAIYAGNGMIWHSPHSGSTVRRVKLWTSAWVAGRFI